VVEELVGEHGVGGQLAHHHHLQTILAAAQSVPAEQLDHPGCFGEGTDERDHDLDVGQGHLVADVPERLALHRETLGEVR
jgi:hypothetical protein